MRSNKDVFAIALIVIGLLLIVQIFDIPFISSFNLGNIIGVLWPLFLLIPGLNMLKERFSLGGLILTLIGGSFLVENLLEIVGISFEGSIIFKFFWPAVLIFIGFKLLTKDRVIKFDEDDVHFGEDGFKDHENTENNAGTAGIMLGSKTYKYKYDELPSGITTLGLNITFGGADIRVDEGIQVIMVGQYSLGGYEFFDSEGGGVHNEIREYRYPDGGDYDKTLVIKTNISFGGIEVKTR